MSFNAVGDALLACLFTYCLTAFGGDFCVAAGACCGSGSGLTVCGGVEQHLEFTCSTRTATQTRPPLSWQQLWGVRRGRRVVCTVRCVAGLEYVLNDSTPRCAVMLSAVMDLLQECLAVSEEALGVYAWVPVAVGVVAACVVLVGLDHVFAGAEDPAPAPRAPVATQPPPAPVAGAVLTPYRDDPADSDHGAFDGTDSVELTIHTSGNTLRERSGRGAASGAAGGRGAAASDVIDGPTAAETRKAWLLFFALTVQHIPEALAMGVAFADADGSGRWGASFSVTLAIGLQDIPEVRCVGPGCERGSGVTVALRRGWLRLWCCDNWARPSGRVSCLGRPRAWSSRCLVCLAPSPSSRCARLCRTRSPSPARACFSSW